MRYLNDKIFEDLMDRFKWYPKPFTLNIFCRNAESMAIFEKEIDNNNFGFQKNKRMKNIRYTGEHKIIDIYLIDDDIFFTSRGRRTNAIIFDGSFPYDVVTEIFIPLANIEPRYEAISFYEGTLEKDLKGICILPNYEIDLEEENDT